RKRSSWASGSRTPARASVSTARPAALALVRPQMWARQCWVCHSSVRSTRAPVARLARRSPGRQDASSPYQRYGLDARGGRSAPARERERGTIRGPRSPASRRGNHGKPPWRRSRGRRFSIAQTSALLLPKWYAPVVRWDVPKESQRRTDVLPLRVWAGFDAPHGLTQGIRASTLTAARCESARF